MKLITSSESKKKVAGLVSELLFDYPIKRPWPADIREGTKFARVKSTGQILQGLQVTSLVNEIGEIPSCQV